MPKLLGLFLGAIGMVLIGADAAPAESPNWDSIAQRIVQQALAVKPGETVVVTGGPDQIEFLGALQVAIEKAGGLTTLQLELPEAKRRSLMETPLEYLGQLPLYEIQQMRLADCFIDVRSIERPGIFADVPEDRVAASRRSLDLVIRAFERARFRRVTIGQEGGIPSIAYAKSQGLDHDELIAMFWRALGVDASEVVSNGKAVASKLRSGSNLRLVTAAGTDLTFEVGDGLPRLNSGRTSDNVPASGVSEVWLPAGETYVCTNPTTAQGTVVVPHLTFRGIPVTDLRMNFKNGRMTRLQAGTNAKILKEFVERAEGDVGVLSVLDIGLNPNSRPLKSSPYASFEMSGVVTLGIGNSAWAGCNVKSNSGLLMHLLDATLTSNGASVVEKGTLQLR